MKLLLIEDDIKKIDDLKDFFEDYSTTVDLTIRKSFQTGLREILRSEFDLVLLDMSMPTWERSINEPGGEFEKFAGIKILKEMSRRGRYQNVVLVTMFDNFGDGEKSITLNDMNLSLQNDFREMYLGAVYYNASEIKWKDELTIMLKKIIND